MDDVIAKAMEPLLEELEEINENLEEMNERIEFLCQVESNRSI